MKRIAAYALAGLVTAVLPTQTSRAQNAEDEVPAIVRAGFDSFKTRGFEEAIRTWMKGSPVEDPSSPSELASKLAPALGPFRAYVGYEVLGVVPIGEHVRRVYASVLFERGAFYAWFDCYHSATGWIIPGFLVNAQPQAILPAEMLRPTALQVKAASGR